MDLYSKFNSLAPNIANLSLDYRNDQQDQSFDFPVSEEPVYILGRKYSSLYELEDIKLDVCTRIWITYRRNFPKIDETNFISDSGWGCMLRAGQMVLAQAMCNLYLGSNWRWKYDDFESLWQLLSKQNINEYDQYNKYREILILFSDKTSSPYSIHHISSMGVNEGKKIGQWFGPNTVAQVLKKLSTIEKTNNIYIHVALDNIVFIDEIKNGCKLAEKNDKPTTAEIFSNGNNNWKPLILFIPLRLGLSKINSIYFRALKTTFTFSQTLGILGGRPNHALYFIGCSGENLIYLDPHTTQENVELAQNLEEIEKKFHQNSRNDEKPDIDKIVDDASYHCKKACLMSITLLDPSLSLCFFCKTEEEFDHWANLVFKKLIHDEQQPLFEIMKNRPFEWPVNDSFQFNCPTTSNIKSNLMNPFSEEHNPINVHRSESSDEDFEIIS